MTRASLSLDAAIINTLRSHADGRTTVELAEATKRTYGEVVATLDRLAARGVVLRSRSRIGSWILGSQTPGAAA